VKTLLILHISSLLASLLQQSADGGYPAAPASDGDDVTPDATRTYVGLSDIASQVLRDSKAATARGGLLGSHTVAGC
jgi:hypothetical protein